MYNQADPISIKTKLTGIWKGICHNMKNIVETYGSNSIAKISDWFIKDWWRQARDRQLTKPLLSFVPLLCRLGHISNCIKTSEYWLILLCQSQGAVSIRKTVLPGMAIPMLKIRRPNGRLIFNMEIAIRR